MYPKLTIWLLLAWKVNLTIFFRAKTTWRWKEQEWISLHSHTIPITLAPVNLPSHPPTFILKLIWTLNVHLHLRRCAWISCKTSLKIQNRRWNQIWTLFTVMAATNQAWLAGVSMLITLSTGSRWTKLTSWRTMCAALTAQSYKCGPKGPLIVLVSSTRASRLTCKLTDVWTCKASVQRSNR